MKAIISSTHDPLYQFFIPITTWCWNKLGVDVVCFMPTPNCAQSILRDSLVRQICDKQSLSIRFYYFNCPHHKEATYSQCSRLYGACLDYDESEILFIGDVDMLLFRIPERRDGGFSIFGADLVPDKQYPMCYVSASVKEWRQQLGLKGKSYQQCLDDLIGDKTSISMRSDFWALDQDELFRTVSRAPILHLINRTNGETPFATKRLDRDDSFILDRLSPDIYDYHANRPGYEEGNFGKIITILNYFYPNSDISWITAYKNQFLCLM